MDQNRKLVFRQRMNNCYNRDGLCEFSSLLKLLMTYFAARNKRHDAPFIVKSSIVNCQ